MSGERYPSVPERITWTTGFYCATDKAVLGTLSTFANFRTGKHADMYQETLVARANLRKRTVQRSLQRLEADGWIVARRRHRRPTVYDINVERLATHWMEAKLVSDRSQSLSATGGGLTDQTAENLSATGDALSAMGGGLEPVLSATGGGPRSPVLGDPLCDHKEPALRAAHTDSSDERPAIVDPSAGAKVDEGPGPPRAPQQLAFGAIGPADSRSPPVRDPNWAQRLADTIRSALHTTTERRKHG